MSKITPKGAATRARIVAQASDLMLERGVARTTVEDIQNAAQVSASQLYHYFADKSELVLAVIDHQTGKVLDTHRDRLSRLDSFAALAAWRDLVVGTVVALHCVGGCPLGSLASDLSETNPLARARLAHSFAQWEGLLRDGLSRMREQGDLGPNADPDELALALLAAIQGGLLLSQTRRDPRPIKAALDAMIAHLHTLAE